MKQYCCSLQDNSAVNNLETVLQALSYVTLPNYMYHNILTAYNKTIPGIPRVLLPWQ